MSCDGQHDGGGAATRRGQRRAALAALAGLLLGSPALGGQEEPGSALDDLEIEDLLAAPIVQSASRRPQSLDEAPGAVTVFEAREIAAGAPHTIADLLRRVPGLWVIQSNANSFQVGLRGHGDLLGSGVLVLLNGRRLQSVSDKAPTFFVLPVHPGEIQRIEVLRGPGAPMYGADALVGVINIVTKRPRDARGSDGSFAVGLTALREDPADPDPLRRERVGNVGLGYAAHSVTSEDGRFGARLSVGFRHQPEWLADDPRNLTRHGGFGYHAGLTLDFHSHPEMSVWLDVRHAKAENDVSPSPLSFTQRRQSSEQSAVLGFEKRRWLIDALSVRAHADARRLQQSTATINNDIVGFQAPVSTLLHGLVQLEASLFGGRNVATVSLEGDYRSMANFFGVSPSSRYGAVVLQDELALMNRRLIVSVAGRFEETTTESGRGVVVRYRNFNPRLSTVLRVSSRHSLRLTGATAFRTPTPFENFVDLVQQPMPPAPPVRTVAANPRLRPTEIASIELAYRGRLSDWLRVGATAFMQRTKHISMVLRTALPLQAEDGLGQDAVGSELEAQVQPWADLSVHGHYTYTATRNRHHDAGLRWPRHIAGLGLTAYLPARLRGDVDFNVVSDIDPRIVTAIRQDIRLSDDQGGGQQHLNVRLGRGLGSGTGELFVSGTNVIGLFRGPPALKQYPIAQVHPIGATVLMGVTIKD